MYVLVASEKVMTLLPFGVVLVSASLPVKPISSTLLRYIFFSPFVPIVSGDHKLSGRHSQAPTKAGVSRLEWIFLGVDRRGDQNRNGAEGESTKEGRRAWEFDPKQSRDEPITKGDSVPLPLLNGWRPVCGRQTKLRTACLDPFVSLLTTDGGEGQQDTVNANRAIGRGSNAQKRILGVALRGNCNTLEGVKHSALPMVAEAE